MANPPGLLGIALIAACVGLAIYEAVAAVRRPRPGADGLRWAVLAMRMVALCLLVAVVVELSVRVDTRAQTSRRVVVLIDESASMEVHDGLDAQAETTRRFDRAREVFEASEARIRGWRAQGLEVETTRFGSEPRSFGPGDDDLFGVDPTASASKLSRALSELADASDNSQVAAVVVLSDGLVAADVAADLHLDEVARDLAVPITTVATGAPALRDLAVADLRVGEFAFVENVTVFEAVLVSHGMQGEQATVGLFRDGTLIESQPVILGDAGDDGQLVRFELAPDRTGEFVYEFRVEPLENEATTHNNSRAFVLKVLRDKVRVLHVAGRPDWDVRALRTLLKRDPNVELLSYYILRDAEDLERGDRTAPMSLIAFPTDELFDSELGSFDLVVMHNFDARTHAAQFLDNIARYVEEGGSLVIIGGDMGLTTAEYSLPALADLLPVDARRQAPLEIEPFRPTLTEAGRRHPITAWLADSGRGDWEDLPELDSFNIGAMSGLDDATALLVHPGHPTRTGSAPLLAVAEAGKGRTMVLSTGASYRLGFAPNLPLIDGARPYDLLWLGAVRWLLRDSSAERLVLETSRPSYQPGQTVELELRTLSASYAPEPAVTVDWRVRRLGDESRPVAGGEVDTDGLGRARLTVDATLDEGPYLAEAERRQSVDAAPFEGDSARRVFIVGHGNEELARVAAGPGTSRLRRLAEETNGTFISASEGGRLPARLPLAEASDTEAPIAARRELPLWNGWIALGLLLLAFPGEWLVRRRQGQR